jgi:cytoskeletal protein CcmA (bactofilin family)
MAENSKIQKKISFSLIILLLITFAADISAQQTGSADNIENLSDLQDEVLKEGPVQKFFAKYDVKQNYRYLLGIIIVIFLVLIILPFIPAIREYIQKKDDQPLYVNMLYSKDPRFFDRSFRSKLLSNVKESGINRAFRVKLSAKEEIVEVCNAADVDDYKFGNNVLYLEGNADITQNMKFKKEVYVTGTTKLNENTIIRGILSEKDLKIAPHSTIVRWAGSEANIYVGHDCDLGVRCSCEKELWLDVDCVFKSLYGHPIYTHYDENIVKLKLEEAKRSEEDPFKTKLETADKEEIIFDESNDPLTVPRFDESETELHSISDTCIVMHKGETTIPSRSVINNNLIIKSKTVINPNTTIKGTIKSYGKLVLKDNVRVEGNVFAEKDIVIGANCHIEGNVFSQGSVEVGSNTEIGREGFDKSLIGKHGVTLAREVKIHGYLLTEGKGKTIITPSEGNQK